MLSLSLIALGLATIGAYATPAVRAVSDLEVVLSTPADKVASASELRVVVTVKNVGDKDLKVVKFGTVLDDDLRAPSFIIRKGDEHVPFTGVAKFSVLTNHLSEPGGLVVIPAGGAVIAEHNVSTAYDFSTTGPGTFTIDPVPWFRVVGLNGTAKTHVADTHSVFITVTDGVSKREVDLEKRTLVFCKDAEKSDLLATNLADSKDLILVVMAYLITYDSDDTLYKDYFGLNPVRSVFDNFSYIYSERSISTILACEGSSDHCLGGIWSYTLDGKTLQFCPSFFAAPTYPPNQLCKDPNLGENSVSGGYVVTQLAKTFLFAEEIKAGCSDSQKLRDGEKLKNAANYKCFALQTYPRAGCSGSGLGVPGGGVQKL